MTMEKRELTCIGCPLGCNVTVVLDNGEISCITGHTCQRGEDYARKEVTHPTRIVTSTMTVEGGCAPVVSVKTKTDIPKDMIFQCVRAIKAASVKAPVHMGDVLLKNVAQTGADVVATKSVAACVPGTD